MKHGFSRRDLLAYGTAGATAFLAGMPGIAAAEAYWGRGKKPKNIIFCVADGMSAAVPSIADQYLRLTTGKGSYWTELMNQDYSVNGLQDTRSLTGVVTDSSAASSAWGCGVHIWNGAVNWLPGGSSGIELRTLMDLLKKEGKMRTGLVTTASITHATPAGFAVCHANRDEEWTIAEKYLKLAPDVLMGGGDKFFAPDKRKDKLDLYKKFEAAGYALAKNAGEMEAASPSKRLLGVFSNGHMPYTVEMMHDTKLGIQVPTLATMAKKAISRLEGGPGFLLQVEGARVDHGGHTNDFAAQLFDQIAFDEAVKTVVEWALKDGDTLVVVTSDHANGNPGLAGAGDEYADSTEGLLKYQNVTCSFGPLLTALKAKVDVDNVTGQLKNLYSIELTKDEAQFVVDGLNKTTANKGIEVFDQDFCNLAMAISNHTHVAYMTHAHTSDHVMVTAVGPGCEFFQGVTRNISYFDHMLSCRDLKHTNPTVSFDDAKKHYLKDKALRAEAAPHWV